MRRDTRTSSDLQYISSEMPSERNQHLRGKKKREKKEMKIFISYAHQDKENMGQLKRYLENFYNFDVFVAHDDILISAEWIDVILSELDSCEIFIPYLTEHFNNSEWTDQETGYVLKRGIKIIPINAGKNPHGFIRGIQAFKYINASDACGKIIGVLLHTPDLKKRTINLLITVYGRSGTFDNAADNLDVILEFESDLTVQQKNEIICLAGINSQIYAGIRAKRKIYSFIRRNQSELNEEYIRSFGRNSGYSFNM